MPWAAALAALGLLLAGWLGIHRSTQLTGTAAAANEFAAPPLYLDRQIAWSVLALAAALACAAPTWEGIRPYVAPAYAAMLTLLALTHTMPATNGAHRWIRLGTIGIQPAEPAKLVLLAALALVLARRPPARLSGLLPPLLLALLPALLILPQPDLGSALVLLMLLGWMLLACNTPWRLLGLLALGSLCALPLLWMGMSREQRSRVTALWRQTAPEERPESDSYHLYQAKQVLALGGMWGSWLSAETASDPARRHLPEAHTDFVFVVIGERLGWPGTGTILLLYTVLVCSLLRAAASCEDCFARLFTTGVAGLFGCQALVNTAMTVGLLPIVGLPLPLVSYGGSSLVTHAAALGLAFSSLRCGSS
jgi:cell division protein FtsW (lipid II flippase)